MASPSESESHFSMAITRAAVAQICQSVGYGAAQASALDVLSDVAARYLKTIAKSAAASANFCGRSQSTLVDIVIALEDLGSVQGFKGASSVFTTPAHSSLISSSSLLKEIMKFISYTDEIPFAQPLPRRILHRMRRCDGGTSKKKIDDDYQIELRHVPRWLPEMPSIRGKEVEEAQGEENLRWGFGIGDEEKMRLRTDGEGKGKTGEKGKGKGKEQVFELPENRGKVRFKIGVGGVGSNVELRGGAGGNGKRVLCHNWNVTEENQEKRMDFRQR